MIKGERYKDWDKMTWNFDWKDEDMNIKKNKWWKLMK